MNRRIFFKSFFNKTILTIMTLNSIYYLSFGKKKIKSLNNNHWYLSSDD